MKIRLFVCAILHVLSLTSSQKSQIRKDVREMRIYHFKLTKEKEFPYYTRTIEEYLHPVHIDHLKSISDTTTNACKVFLTSVLDLKNDKTKFSYNLNSTLAQQWGFIKGKHTQHFFLSPLNNKICCLALYDTL